MHKILFPLRVYSLFPPVLWKSCNKRLLDLKVKFPGDSQSPCWIPKMGSLTWRSEPSQRWENFLGIIVLQMVVRPPREYRIWFYCVCAPLTTLLWLLLCFWRWGVFFVGCSIFLLMVVQWLVMILVLSWEEVSVCPSTPPYWTGSQWFHFLYVF